MVKSRILRRSLTSLFLTALIASSFAYISPQSHADAGTYSQVGVLVDSSQSDYNYYFKIGVEKWLKWWKIDYSLIDLAFTELTQAILSNYNVILVGQYGILTKLTASELSAIKGAVYNGVGLVQLDPRNYDSSFLEIFGVQPVAWIQSSDKLNFTIKDNSHFITSIYENNSEIAARLKDWSSPLESPVIYENVSVTTGKVLVTLRYQKKNYPAIVCNNYGSGKAVLATFATGSIPLQFEDVNGFGEKPSKTSSDIHGLLLRSLIWTSREPLVFLGLPPFVSFRVDDAVESYLVDPDKNQHYLENIVNDGMFVDLYYMLNSLYASPEWQNRLRNLYLNNQIRIAPHALSQTSPIYYDVANGKEYSNQTLAAYFANIDGNLTQWGITSSSLIAPHDYRIGANAVPFLLQRGWTSADMKFAIPPTNELQNTWMYSENSYQFPLVFDYADQAKTIRVLDFGPPTVIYGGEHGEYDFLGDPGLGSAIYDPANVTAIIERLLFTYEHALSAMYPGEAMTHEAKCVYISEAQWNTVWTAVFSELKNLYPFVIPTSMETVSYYLQARENVNVADYSFDGSQVVVDFSGNPSSSVAFYLFTGGKKIVSYTGILDRIQPYEQEGYLLWLPPFSNGHSVSLTLGNVENTIPQVLSSNANITSTSYDGTLSINAGPIWKHINPIDTFEIDCKNLGAPIQVAVNGVNTLFNYTNNEIRFQVNLPASSQITISWSPRAPFCSNVGYNTTLAKSPCQFYSMWQDDDGLSGYIFSTNNTGAWVNETWMSLTGNSAWANVTKMLNGQGDLVIGYKWYCNDTNNNWNSTGTLTLTTILVDIQPPTYSNIGTNTTVASSPCQFSCYWQDNGGLSGYVFSSNNSGVWVNDTFEGLSGLAGWANKTKILVSTIGNVVGYRWYCKDASNNWNDTGIQTLATIYSAAPQYSNVSYSTTEQSRPCVFSALWSDDQGLSGYIFGTNLTGFWMNETFSALSGLQSWANITKTLATTAGARVEFQWWCNDSQNQWNTTGPGHLVTTAGQPPIYSNVGYNSTLAGNATLFSCYWQDSVGLSGYIFSWNETGAWQNETWTAINGLSAWSNATKTLPSTIGAIVGFRWYCNDTDNNWNNTGIQTLTTSATPRLAVFGKTTIGALQDNVPVGYVIAARFQAPANGTATQISAYIKGYESGSVKTAIYSDVNGAVGTLLFESSQINLLSTWSWHNFSASYDIQSGSYYWFAVFASQQLCFHYDTGQTNQEAQTWGWTYPVVLNNFNGHTSYYTDALSIYVTYEPSVDNNTYSLTVSTVGSGSVVKVPDQASYHLGDSVTLTATPSAGWSFSAWSGDFASSVNPVSVIINGTTSATATFTQNVYTLTVTTVGSGSVNRNNSGPYYYGYVVELTAVPAIDWSFDHWSGDLSGSANPANIVMNGNKTATATFTQNTYILTVNVVGSGSVTLNNTGPHYYGDLVQLTAIPSLGWSFDHWSGDLGGSANPATLTIDGNKSVTANFTQNVYTLTVTTIGSGSVNLNSTGPYHYGDIVQLTAVAVTGWSFQGWSGDLSGSTNPTTILISGDKSVTATFVQDQYILTVTIVGSGSVSKSPNQANYTWGTNVTLNASADVGWTFAIWTGDAPGTVNPITVNMTGSKTVTATFTQDVYTLTVVIVGSGSVNRNSTGPYHYGDVVELTAVPAAGWSFQSWTDDLFGSANPATILIDSNKGVTATFTQNVYSLTVSVVGSGSVVKVPDQASYHLGDVVQLTATAAVGWSFSGWSGALTGSANPATILMDGNKSVTANFTQNEYTLIINIVGSGTVDKNPDKATYHFNDVVQLNAVSASGWTFSSWSGDLTGSTNPTSITVTGNKSVTANFTHDVYTLNVTTVGSGSVSRNNTGPYYYGDVVELTAVPATGWSLDHWSDDLSGSANPANIVMNGNKTATATFIQIKYTLTVTVVGSGSVTLNNTGPYYGDVVQLTALPSLGWSFDNWSGDLSGSVNPTTILINGNKTVTATFTINLYTITASSGSGGVIDPSGSVLVLYGEDKTFTITPNVGYHIADVLVDSVSVGPVESYTFTTVITNHTIAASFSINRFTMTASAGAGGVISPFGSVPVNYGEDITFTITPNIGYHVADVIVDGSTVGAVVSYTFTAVQADHVISASFAIDQYSITASAGIGGSINPSGSVLVSYGDSKTFTIAADTGYHIADVLVDSVSVGAFSEYTFSTVSSNHSIAATFTINQYTITASAGTGGSVNPSGSVVVDYGKDQSFTITPDAGYHIFDVLVDGASVGAVPSYTFWAVSADHTITASFAINQYTIMSSAGVGGSINPSGSVLVAYGETKTFTITPDVGYHVVDIVVDSLSQGVIFSYTFTAVQTDHTISASFAINQYTITASAGFGGNITPDGSILVNYGEDKIFTITPNTGYHISDVLVDSTSVGSVSSYTFKSVTADHAITASFALNQYTITASAGLGGVIDPSGSVLVLYGEDEIFTITPDTGYHVVDVVVDGLSQGLVYSYTFTAVSSDHTISAFFSINEYTITASAGPGGVINPFGSIVVSYGNSQTFIIAPDTGYHILDVLVDSISQGPLSSYTFTFVTANHDIAASFAINRFTISASAGTGGGINPSGSVSASYGEDVTFTITHDAGYYISDVVVDIVSVGAVPSYTFLAVSADHTISASFTQIEYTLNVTVSPDGSGSVSKNPDYMHYHYNDVVQLTAIPSAGYNFSAWSGNLSGSVNPTTILIDGNKSVTANFTQNEYALTINIIGLGTVSKSPDKDTYHYGDVIQLTATAAVGWSFSAWSGTFSSSLNPVSVTINGTTSVTATFTRDQYSLTMYTIGQGTVVPGNQTFASGTVVDIKAINALGWTFAGWSGGASGSSNTTVTMNGPVVVTAAFTQNTYTLAVATSGSGSVDLNNTGPYYYGDVVQLTALPSLGWSFDQWIGDLGGSTNPATLTIDGNKSVTANFTQNVYTLTVTPTGSGSVNLNSTGPYHYGDLVELTAVPDAGWSFQSWSGDLFGSANPATILIDSNKSVTATFTRNVYTLTATIAGSGSVSRNNTGPYYYGDVVELTAVPAVGWSFQSWSGDLLGSTNPATILMDGNKSVTASFMQQCIVTFFTDPAGSGYNITFQEQTYLNDTTAAFPFGTSGLATASVPSGWVFDHWTSTGNVVVSNTTANPTTVTITSNGTLKAVYAAEMGFSVTKSPASRSIAAGSAPTFTVTASLLYGTPQSVSFSCSGLPPNATASFSPASGLPTFSSTLKITTTTSTPPGIYTITVTGSSPYTSNWTTLQLKIMNFSVAPTPFSPNGDGVKDTTTVESTFWDSLVWTLTVKNSTGIVRHLGTGTASSISMAWDGRDDAGAIVADGTYTVSLVLPGLTKTGSVVVDTTPPTVTCSWNRSPFNPRSGQTSKLTCNLSEKCSIYIQIYDSSGNLVRTLLAPTTKNKGTFSVTWNGKDDSGVIVPSGTYTCKIFATDMAGNQASPYPTTCQIVVS